jgi:hypothetical protein
MRVRFGALRPTSVTPVLTGVLVVLAMIVSFGPWVRSGAALRSSYAATRSATNLDLLHGTWAKAMGRSWSFLPLVGTLALLALVLDLRRAAAVLAAVLGLAETALALLVLRSPDLRAWGTVAGLFLGLALLGAATALWATRPEGTTT